MLRGNIDLVRPEGIVEGWCWDDQDPDERIEVSIVVDGVVAGTGLAGLYREDLRQAEVGDGFHQFNIVLSHYVANKRSQTFTLTKASTSEVIGAPVVVHAKHTLTFDDRLVELETKNRLLETQLNEIMQYPNSGDGSAALFSVVGAFFMKLADDVARGVKPSFEQRLDGALKATLNAYPMIDFVPPERSRVTIVIEAACSLPQLYACLAALHQAKVSVTANVVVLDPGAFDEIALTPSIVRGVGYVRTIADLATEWMEVERKATSDILVMLSGRAVVHESWLAELFNAFAADAAAGAVGSRVMDDGGSVQHGGLCVVDGKLVDCADTHPDPRVNVDVPHAVHALSHHVIGIRRHAFDAVGGLNLTYGNDLGAAVVDLCFRLREHRWSIILQPFATLSLLPSLTGQTWLPPCSATQSRLGELLRAKWFSGDVVHSLVEGKRAVVIGDKDETIDEVLVLRRLRDSNYMTTYIGPTNMTLDRVNDLERAGVSVIVTDDAGQTLARSQADVVYAIEEVMVLEQSPHGSRIAMNLEQLELLLAESTPDGSVI